MTYVTCYTSMTSINTGTMQSARIVVTVGVFLLARATCTTVPPPSTTGGPSPSRDLPPPGLLLVTPVQLVPPPLPPLPPLLVHSVNDTTGQSTSTESTTVTTVTPTTLLPDVVPGLLMLIPEPEPLAPPLPKLHVAINVTANNDTAYGNTTMAPRPGCGETGRECSAASETRRVYGEVDFVGPVYRYTAPPVLGLLLLVTAGFTCALLVQARGGSQLNKASSLLLAAIAVSDMLTVAAAIPELVFRYSSSATNHGALPHGSCHVMYVLERLSAVPHTASIWMTAVLAAQRYICVAKPFFANRIISVRSSFVLTGVISALASVFHACRFVDASFEHVNISKREYPNITIETCDLQYASWVSNPVTYEVVFAWTRVVIVQLIPCVLLVTFGSMMIRSLHARSPLLTHTHADDEKRNMLSIFVVIVSLIVSVVEIVSGGLICIHAVSISIGRYIVEYEHMKAAAIGIDIMLYVSYFCVFIIYCFMSRKFRKGFLTLLALLTCRKVASKDKKSGHTESSATKSSRL